MKKPYVFLLFISAILTISNVLECNISPYFGEEGEDALRGELTIITTSHPIPSNPSTAMIERTQRSLFLIPEFRGCHKIIVIDNLPENLSNIEKHLSPSEVKKRIARNPTPPKKIQKKSKKKQKKFLRDRAVREIATERFEAFKKNMENLVKEDPYFSNTTLVFCEKHLHLTFSIREALKAVTTPFVFIHQHDFELIKTFDAVGLIDSMQLNPNLKHVRLNRFWNHLSPDALLDKYVEGGSLVPLLRTDMWSDNDHFSPVEYYTDFVLPKFLLRNHTFMEWVLGDEESKSVKEDISNHLKYGTYVYGQMEDSPYIDHLDGSRHYGGNWEY